MRQHEILLRSLVLASLVACGDVTNPSQMSAGFDRAIAPDLVVPPDTGYVLTPAGRYHSSCVHTIPNGARLNGTTGVVTRADSTNYVLPGCTYPSYQSRPATLQAGVLPPPSADTNWVEYAWEHSSPITTYRYLADVWHVPPAPVNAYADTEVFYTFPALEPEDASRIIQPVIRYTKYWVWDSKPWFGHWVTGWTGASWRCEGTSCVNATRITTATNDSMSGAISASACVSGTCTWTITTVDVSTSGRSALLVDADGDDYRLAFGGVVETHGGFTSCGDFPKYGVTFTGITLQDRSGSVMPEWLTNSPSAPDPDCDFDAIASADTVQLVVNPPALALGINGPTSVDSGDVQEWDGYVQHFGLPPYNWWWTGILSGSGSSYIYGAPTQSGELIVHASDQVPDTAVYSIYVYVCDPPPAICPFIGAPGTARVFRHSTKSVDRH